MRMACTLLVLVFIAPAGPVSASALTDDCHGPAAQIAIDCLQPKLDTRVEQAQIAFERTLTIVAAAQRDAPDAGVDIESVIKALRAAKERWEAFAGHECAAAREFVGNGTDRNNVELVCLIQLYDQRIQQIESWRSL